MKKKDYTKIIGKVKFLVCWSGLFCYTTDLNSKTFRTLSLQQFITLPLTETEQLEALEFFKKRG